MNNNWTKLTVKCLTEDIDTVAAVMGMLETSLMIEDFSDFSFSGMYGELVDDSILNADTSHGAVSIFVPEERPVPEYRAFLSERFDSLGISVSYEISGVCEDDWAENWKKYYKPVHLGRVTVVPRWEKYTPAEDEVIVRMDPGMAFGTGTHETTRLVIRLMQDENLTGLRVLDVGTGSGILSICASKLGAEKINAYDIDPVAVKVALDNVQCEGCDNIEVGVSDLLLGVDTAGGKFDFCVANIVADIILRMLPDIGSYLTDDAPIIVSGIIAPRADDVISAAAEYGYRVVKQISENDWVALMLRRDRK